MMLWKLYVMETFVKIKFNQTIVTTIATTVDSPINGHSKKRTPLINGSIYLSFHLSVYLSILIIYRRFVRFEILLL